MRADGFPLAEPARHRRSPTSIATADISVFTNKDVREVVRGHVNLAAFDTLTREQSASDHLDRHPAVTAHAAA